MDIKIRDSALSVRGSDFEVTDDPLNEFEFELLTALGTNQADSKFGTRFEQFKIQPDALQLVKSEVKRIMQKHDVVGKVTVYGTAHGIHIRIETEVSTIDYVLE